MKKFLFVLASMMLCCVAFNSCGDDDDESKDSDSGVVSDNNLLGTWQLVEWRDYDLDYTWTSQGVTIANMDNKEYETMYDDDEIYSFSSDGTLLSIQLDEKSKLVVVKYIVSAKDNKIKVIKGVGMGEKYIDYDYRDVSTSKILSDAQNLSYDKYSGLTSALTTGTTMEYSIIGGKLYVVSNELGSTVSIYEKK